MSAGVNLEVCGCGIERGGCGLKAAGVNSGMQDQTEAAAGEQHDGEVNQNAPQHTNAEALDLPRVRGSH
eukprot:1185040-Prorocentrum_minimum.AAC.3